MSNIDISQESASSQGKPASPAEATATCVFQSFRLANKIQSGHPEGKQCLSLGAWGLREIQRLFAIWHRYQAGEITWAGRRWELVPVQARLGRLLQRFQGCGHEPQSLETLAGIAHLAHRTGQLAPSLLPMKSLLIEAA